MAVDGETVYWPEMFSPLPGLGVYSAPTVGGMTRQLATVPMGSYAGLAVDASSVYFGGVEGAFSVPRSGGAAMPLWSTNDSTSPLWMALADGFLFFTTVGKSGGAILRVPVGGGAAELLADGAGPSGGLALYAGNVYFASDSTLRHSPDSGGASELLSASAFTSSPGWILLAVDASGVYATSYESDDVRSSWGRVSWTSLDGRTTEVIAHHQGYSIGPPVLDSTTVYWATCCGPGGGTVMRAPKCLP
jgi:hypothetical protein